MIQRRTLEIHQNLKMKMIFADDIYSHHLSGAREESRRRAKMIKGGPEPLEKESHEFFGSKRDDRFSNPFFEMVPKTCQGSFFLPALA